MNRKFYIFLLLFLFIYCNFIFSEEILISEIVIVIDEITYIWDDKENIPDKSLEGYTYPVTVTSFLTFSPGDKITKHKLSRKIKLAQERLSDCGFFSSTAVNFTGNNEQENQQTSILIELKEGNLFRFGAGNLYAFFGRRNLWGLRKSFTLYSGYNLNGISFIDNSFLKSNFILGTSIFYRNQGLGIEEIDKYNSVSFGITSGYRVHPDWMILLNQTLRFKKYPARDISNKYFYLVINPQFKGKTYIGKPDYKFLMQLKLDSLNYYSFYDKKIYPALTGKISIDLPFLNRNSFNFQYSTGAFFKDTGGSYVFNLFSYPDRSVRSGYLKNDLLCDKFHLLNIEYRLELFEFTIPPFINTSIEIFAFTDLGFPGLFDEKFRISDFKDAYGFGLRVLLNEPIYAYFSFSYGFNNKGEGRFVYTFTKGF